jgi:hypothetical protein
LRRPGLKKCGLRLHWAFIFLRCEICGKLRFSDFAQRSNPRVSRCPQIHGSVAESIDVTAKLNIAEVGINYKFGGPVVANIDFAI